MAEPTDVQHLVQQLTAGPAPTLLEVPTEVRGFRVQLDLHGAEPPVWRRLELPGDLTLPRLHDVIQSAMGWSNSHLHRFRTGNDHRSPSFVTTFDLEEGDEGMLEDDVRLDQLVAAEGDELWYDYDFGDGWDHRLRVEAVLDEPPPTVQCTGGRMACPPEDCGGIGGHHDVAAWVRSGYDDALLPEPFANAAHAHDWLPVDWHPDHFDLEEVNEALKIAVAEPVAVVGDGVALTGAGYLSPVVVEQFAERSGITGWWIGKANREDLTPPVADVRDTARALGLVSVRKGRLAPTAAATRCRHDPQALRQHIVGRLPLGSKETDRQAGWMALAVVGSGVPAQEWRDEIVDLLFALGWRSGYDRVSPPPAHSPTLQVLDQLAGAARTGWRPADGVDVAVAATARAVVVPS